MSEVIYPPEYYFTGINFNPAFYAEDNTGGALSQAVANTLYLRKTVADTATAQETFTAGIVTSSVASTGTGASNILNIGIAPRTVSGAVHHYSDGDNCVSGAGVHLNNGTNNNSTTNIHNGTGANPSGIVNIMTGAFNSGNVNIGGTTVSTSIFGTLTCDTIKGILNTGTQSLFSTKTGGTLNIATSQTSGSISIGGSGSSLAISSTNVAIYSTDTYIAGPLAVGSTNKNAIANFIGTSGFPTSIACRPFNSDTTTLIDFYNTAGGGRGAVQGVNSGAIFYATSSDRRLKTNIEPLDPMLDKVMSLKPSKYNWKEDNANGYGFIAQEVYELFPQMRVWTPQMSGDIDEPVDKDGKPIHYGLDYGQFTPYIVKAVQELKQDYDAKLSKLEARLLALET
jgi:hypothetical protein